MTLDAALEKCASLKPWVNGGAIEPEQEKQLVDWIAKYWGVPGKHAKHELLEHLDVDVVM